MRAVGEVGRAAELLPVTGRQLAVAMGWGRVLAMGWGQGREQAMRPQLVQRRGWSQRHGPQQCQLSGRETSGGSSQSVP